MKNKDKKEINKVCINCHHHDVSFYMLWCNLHKNSVSSSEVCDKWAAMLPKRMGCRDCSEQFCACRLWGEWEESDKDLDS